MDYTAESLIPVMAHIAKNVVKVNEGLTKHIVSVKTCIAILWLAWTSIDSYVTEQWHNTDLDFSPSATLFLYLNNLVFLQAIKGKYSTSKQMRIATIPQLKSSVVKDLAKQVTQWEEDWMFLAPCADLYSFNLNFLTWPEGSAR